MVGDTSQKIYKNQINDIIHGFMQLWIKFDVVLPAELARVQQRLNGIKADNESTQETNYQLFYRFSNSIYNKSNLTMGELSNAMGVPFSTATRIADWMVSKEYAQRLHDPEDRRIVRIALTDSGRELHETIEDYIGERVQHFLSHLSPDEQMTLVTIFHKVISAFKEELSE